MMLEIFAVPRTLPSTFLRQKTIFIFFERFADLLRILLRALCFYAA